RIEWLSVNAAKMKATMLLTTCNTMLGSLWPVAWAAWTDQVHRTLKVHNAWVCAVAGGPAGDCGNIVSARTRETGRVWGAGRGVLRGQRLIGHGRGVTAVAVGRAGDRDVIVSASYGLVRVWDAVTGAPRGQPLIGHDGAVTAVAVGRAGDRDVI